MREPELQVASVTYADPTTILKEVESAYPDVIVISEAGPPDLPQTSELLHRILPQEILRVIVIRPDDNILEVYDKQCLKVTSNDDLIALIKNR